MKEYRNEKGLLHREDGPAIELSDNTKEWWLNGKQHREDGPAVIDNNGNKFWYQNDELHRVGGSAVELSDGGQEWCFKGKLHRLDGPAVIYNGIKEWWVNGKLHRLDGPAIEWSNGDKEWVINDEEYSEEKFQQLTSFPKESYSTNEAGITYIRLEDNLGIRICFYTELFINGTYKIVNDETLEQLIRGIDKDNPILNPIHDYILENLTSLNI
jgi:hypothetical protein